MPVEQTQAAEPVTEPAEEAGPAEEPAQAVEEPAPAEAVQEEAPETEAAAEPAAEQAPVQVAAEVPAQAPAENSVPVQNTNTAKARKVLPSGEWILTLAKKDPLILSAFGEDHLRDFIDEALDNTSMLYDGLIELEKISHDHEDAHELVNTLFRNFHNLKGNSGLVGFHDLNALTHEAETLLNRARQGELVVTNDLIDLLLIVVDVMEALIRSINISAGNAAVFDTSELLAQLKDAVAGNPPSLPPSIFLSDDSAPEEQEETKQEGGLIIPGAPELQELTHAGIKEMPLTSIGAGLLDSDDDLALFQSTVKQQYAVIQYALKELEKDPTVKAQQDALFRGYTAIQNASSFMEFAELKEYAQRTANIVDQGRTSDIGFECLVPLLDQETDIIVEMANNAIEQAVLAKNPELANSAETAETPKAEEKPAQLPRHLHRKRQSRKYQSKKKKLRQLPRPHQLLRRLKPQQSPKHRQLLRQRQKLLLLPLQKKHKQRQKPRHPQRLLRNRQLLRQALTITLKVRTAQNPQLPLLMPKRRQPQAFVLIMKN